MLMSSKVRPHLARTRPFRSFAICAFAYIVVAVGVWWIFYGSKPVDPKVSITWRIMPFDPPYPLGTVIAGMQFDPKTVDVRLFLKVEDARIKNVDLTITLIETSGQMLGIRDVGQLTRFAGMSFTAVTGVPAKGSDSITIIGSNKVTIPRGGTSPEGSLHFSSSERWRIHCTELLEKTTPEFVFMVDRPYRASMIEGFKLTGTYDFDGGKGTINEVVVFSEKGDPRSPTPEELERIQTYKRPQGTISGMVLDVTGTGVYPMLPPEWGTNYQKKP